MQKFLWTRLCFFSKGQDLHFHQIPNDKVTPKINWMVDGCNLIQEDL